jgi:hypothetical protein
VRGGEINEEEKRVILKRLIEKSHIRDIDPDIDSMGRPEIKELARKEWQPLKLEVSELPNFEGEFETVEAFYRSLPWHGL